MRQLTFQDMPDSGAITVSELTDLIKSSLETTFSSVLVVGEVTDLARPRSGHLYFTLKDGHSQLRVIVWRSTASRLAFQIENGQQIVCRGPVEVYAARGTYQIVARSVQPVGMGDLQIAFQQLHRRLAEEGLFDPDRKQPLPRFPVRIGFVTSATGAAIRDFIEIAARRSPAIQVVIIPATVQGKDAAESIVRGIGIAHRIDPPLDVLVIGRGGGSLEDLWCFNEERVVRAIDKATLPIVSAVGHEVDVTLSDLVADRRAATPSEAAELLVPSAAELRRLIDSYVHRMVRPIRVRLEQLRKGLREIESRPVFAKPHRLVTDYRAGLDELDFRAQRAIAKRLDESRQQLSRFSVTLEALSPLGVLGRGYSITECDKKPQPLRTASEAAIGDTLRTRLHAGYIESRVEKIHDPYDASE